MTPVALPSVPQGPKAPPGAGAQQTRAALHTDFRSLLRGQTLGREPLPAAPARAPSPGQARRPTEGAPGEHRTAGQGGSGNDDDAGELAPLGPEDDPLDPFARHRASLAPPDAIFDRPEQVAPLPETPLVAAPPETPVLRAAAGSLEELLPALVRRVAWSGDGRSGTVRLELGAGPLAGATLLVHADAGRVRVRLDLPAGVDAADWEQRIRQRLEARRIATDGVEVA
jgi:hypothetical protein